MEMDERIVIKDTPEKYAEMAKVIVPPFLELMKTLTDLEDKAFVRSGELDAEKAEMGIPSSIIHPGYMEFINAYRAQYREALSGMCTKKLFARPFGVSIHHPARYLDALEGTVFFTMKSDKKAMIDIKNNEGRSLKHRFIFKVEDDVWKIDEVRYGFGEEDKWYVENL